MKEILSTNRPRGVLLFFLAQVSGWLCLSTPLLLVWGETGAGPGFVALTTNYSASAPRIQFATTNLALGRVLADGVVKCAFIYTNLGQQVLEITAVRSSCGCAVAGAWSRQVEPGATGTILLELRTTHLNGSVSKSIQIDSNDPLHPTADLRISATVWRPIEVNPTQVAINFADPPASLARTVWITNHCDHPLVLSLPELGNTNFTATLKTYHPGSVFALELRAVSPPASGAAQFPVKLKTTCTNMPWVEIKVYAFTPPPIEVTPAEIILEPKQPGSRHTAVVTVRSNLKTPLSVWDPRVSLPGAQVALSEALPGRLFTVSVSFPTRSIIGSAPGERLTLKTSAPGRRELIIPIYRADPYGRASRAPSATSEHDPQAELRELVPAWPSPAKTIPATESPARPAEPAGLPATQPKPPPGTAHSETGIEP